MSNEHLYEQALRSCLTADEFKGFQLALAVMEPPAVQPGGCQRCLKDAEQNGVHVVCMGCKDHVGPCLNFMPAPGKQFPLAPSRHDQRPAALQFSPATEGIEPPGVTDQSLMRLLTDEAHILGSDQRGWIAKRMQSLAFTKFGKGTQWPNNVIDSIARLEGSEPISQNWQINTAWLWRKLMPGPTAPGDSGIEFPVCVPGCVIHADHQRPGECYPSAPAARSPLAQHHNPTPPMTDGRQWGCLPSCERFWGHEGTCGAK